MYELKKNGKVFTSKFVGTGPSSYEKRIYWAAVSQRLRNTDVEEYGKAGQATDDCSTLHAGKPRLQTHTLNMLYLVLSHYNNGYSNAHYYYVIRILPLLC